MLTANLFSACFTTSNRNKRHRRKKNIHAIKTEHQINKILSETERKENRKKYKHNNQI